MYVSLSENVGIRDIFSSPDSEQTQIRLNLYVKKYKESVRKLDELTEQNILEGFSAFVLTKSHHRYMRTTNTVERLDEEIKRRTQVAGLFPNEPSLPRFVCWLLMETDRDWLTGKRYLDMTVENDTPSLTTEENLQKKRYLIKGRRHA